MLTRRHSLKNETNLEEDESIIKKVKPNPFDKPNAIIIDKFGEEMKQDELGNCFSD